MSGKRNKLIRKNQLAHIKNTSELLNKAEIPKDEMYEYMYSLFKRYAGYTCVSLSKPGSVYEEGIDKNVVPITMHKYVPALNEKGKYVSPGDKVVEFVKINNDKFEGVIMDRYKRIALGDVFKQQRLPPVTKEEPVKENAEII